MGASLHGIPTKQGAIGVKVPHHGPFGRRAVIRQHDSEAGYEEVSSVAREVVRARLIQMDRPHGSANRLLSVVGIGGSCAVVLAQDQPALLTEFSVERDATGIYHPERQLVLHILHAQTVQVRLTVDG